MKIKYFCFDLRLFVCLGYGLGSAPTPNTLSLIHLVMVMVMFNGKLLVFYKYKKKAKNGLLYHYMGAPPMLRRCIKCSWAWKKMSILGKNYK